VPRDGGGRLGARARWRFRDQMSSRSTWSRHRAYEPFVNEEQKLLLQIRVARALFREPVGAVRVPLPPLKLGAVL
jgi:hypothetical protein